MYQTMKIESLSKVIPFFDFSVVEKISVDAVKHCFVAMKVDHMKGIIIFGNLVSFLCAITCLLCCYVAPKFSILADDTFLCAQQTHLQSQTYLYTDTQTHKCTSMLHTHRCACR